MREILFRGKRLDNGAWMYGDLRQYSEKQIGIYSYELRQTVKGIDPSTVGQFTGLYDKNGVRIFEEDILQLDYIGTNRGVNGKALVFFENCKFGVLWGWRKEFVPLDGFANTTLEVIGNIHDNPELLEGEDE